jgi:hypothetical protein
MGSRGTTAAKCAQHAGQPVSTPTLPLVDADCIMLARSSHTLHQQ